MIDDIIREMKAGMDKSVEAYQKDLKRIRTGRASLALLDGIMVDYYGSPTPLTSWPHSRFRGSPNSYSAVGFSRCSGYRKGDPQIRTRPDPEQ